MPPSWQEIALGELGDWYGGGTPSKSNASYWEGGSIPWASPKDVKRDRIDSTVDSITQSALDGTSLRLVPKDSLLFVTRSGILAHTLPVAMAAVPMCINQDLKALTLFEGVHPEFIQLQLQFRAADLLRQVVKQGTTVQSVDFRSLKAFVVALPSFEEQRFIAGRLRDSFERIAGVRLKLEAATRHADAYRAVALRRALSGDLTRGWAMENSVPPAQETTLAEIANIGSGLALGKRNGAQKLVERPYLRVANVQRGRIDIGDVRRVQVSVADAERFRLQPGDILMNEGGDRDKLGRGAVWTGEVPDCIHQNHVFRVRLLDANYPPDYVSLYANEAGQAYFNENATQTTNLASISKAKLSRMPIRIPHASEANEILRIVSGGDRFLGALNENIGLASNRLLSLHGALSRRAFSGKLLFQPVEEESRDAPLVDRPISASRRRKPKKAKVDRRTMMDKLFDAVASWPKDGLTFEEIRTLFPGDYESLKDAVFDSLSGDLPSLVQRYDEAAEVMRFMRKAP